VASLLKNIFGMFLHKL